MSGPDITAGLGGCNVAVEEHHTFLENAVIQIVQGAYLATVGYRIPYGQIPMVSASTMGKP